MLKFPTKEKAEGKKTFKEVAKATEEHGQLTRTLPQLV